MEGLVVLREPACIGQSERVVLEELSKKLGRKFDDVWELADWLSVNRPDIDLEAPLRLSAQEGG